MAFEDLSTGSINGAAVNEAPEVNGGSALIAAAAESVVTFVGTALATHRKASKALGALTFSGTAIATRRQRAFAIGVTTFTATAFAIRRLVALLAGAMLMVGTVQTHWYALAQVISRRRHLVARDDRAHQVQLEHRRMVVPADPAALIAREDRSE